ncbi:hypothetical protein HW555_004713 [Spodoptera exigua]|uniref:Uncharacterized protein n=1 Tax=Spodoptera exigua TaxID=7107 RepID=A0A835GLU0_SPOEX|nr:hypothetical protein HW555_004713 [Spodoptera exigua]
MNEITTEREMTNTIDIINDPNEIYEQDMKEEQQYLEENTQEVGENCDERRPSKRDREDEDEDGWTEVGRNKGKKCKGEKIEIYISCNEKMPKQFALAKFFKNEGILDIDKIKYINPYKIRVEMRNEDSMMLLEKSKEITNRGWRVQKAMEVNLSYGVIRDVDIDLTEKEMLERIECAEPAQLVAVHRLMRRTSEGEGWKPSESARLCFKGSFRPAYIFVDGLRIRVEQYIFPVTQCSRCWKLGHTIQKCTSVKVICPKCTGNHGNCDTTSFKCTNCGGQHMALVRSCPAFLKEKRLRELMAEFNCTYRRAMTMYVPVKENKQVDRDAIAIEEQDMAVSQNGKLSFSAVLQQPRTEVITLASRVDSPPASAKKSALNTHKQKQSKKPIEVEVFTREDTLYRHEDSNTEKDKAREVQFSELISRLKEILFLKGGTVHQKVQSCLKCCVQWVILVLVENISDWPILKLILDYLGYNE